MKTPTLLLLVVLVAAVSVGALFQDHSDIKTLSTYQEFQDSIRDSDHVVMVIFASDDCERCSMVEGMLTDLEHKLHGFLKVRYADCEALAEDDAGSKAFPFCAADKRDKLPTLIYFEPPQYKINPYTKKPMMPKEHPFSGQLTVDSVLDTLNKISPSYREQIKSKDQLETFLSHPKIPAKVILFTNKKETTLLYRGLTAEFKDRIKFGEVFKGEEEIVDQFNVQKFPTLYVITREDGKKDDENVVKYDGELKYDKLKSFLKPYALPEKYIEELPKMDEKPQENKQEEKKKKAPEPPKPVFLTLNSTSYQKFITASEKFIIVQFVKGGDAYPLWSNLTKSIGGLASFGIFNVSSEENGEEFAKSQDIKNYPSLKVYSMGSKKSIDKVKKSVLKGSVTVKDVRHELYDMIPDNTKSLSPPDMQPFIMGHLFKRHFVVILFHNKQEIPLEYKVIANMDKYADGLGFSHIKNPPTQLKKEMGITTLPKLVVVFRQNMPEEEETPEEIQTKADATFAQFNSELTYDALVAFCDQFTKLLKGGAAAETKIELAKTQEDLDNLCIKKGGVCIIGLLNGDTKQNKLLVNQTDAIHFAKTRLAQRPIHFLWVDVKCHPELLAQIEMPYEYVPTAISYAPSKKMVAQLVGTMEKDSMRVFSENALRGRVTSNSISQPLTLEEKDCDEEHKKRDEIDRAAKESSDQGSGSNDMEDEILKEIMEEQRKKQEELEKLNKKTGSGHKKKKKKNKKAKKTKKGKGKGKKDDL